MGGQHGATGGRRDEVVLITGCSDGGIGASLAMEFSNVGYSVVATSRSLHTMKKLQEHPHVETLAIDITVEASIREAVETIMAKYGRIDILVNNAGVPADVPVAEAPSSLVTKTFQTNLFGPLLLIQAVVPHMAARGKGVIANIGSILAYVSIPWGGIYSSSKAALHALSDALRQELKPFGINVIVIAPGAIISGIGTKGATIVTDYIKDLSLKLYKPYEGAIIKRAGISQTPQSTPTDDFAKKAVAAITSSRVPSYFTYGHLSRTLWWLYYAPTWVQDWSFASMIPTVKLHNKKKD